MNSFLVSSANVHYIKSNFSREYTHRVKSVSMAKFTSQEVSALQGGGNEVYMQSSLYTNVFMKYIEFLHWLLLPCYAIFPAHSVRGRFISRSGIHKGILYLIAGMFTIRCFFFMLLIFVVVFDTSFHSNVERLRDFIRHVYVDKRYTGERSIDKPPRVKMVSMLSPSFISYSCIPYFFLLLCPVSTKIERSVHTSWPLHTLLVLLKFRKKTGFCKRIESLTLK